MGSLELNEAAENTTKNDFLDVAQQIDYPM